MARMTPVDMKARAEKTVASLVKTFQQAIRKAGGTMGETMVSEDNGEHTIIIENNLGGYAQDMMYLVHQHPHAIYVSHQEHKGFFDWSADTYIKDAASVTFRF